MTARTYTTKQGDTLDGIAYAAYGKTSGAVEAILEANKGLENQPVRLPAGLIITLPVVDTTKTIKTVQLFD